MALAAIRSDCSLGLAWGVGMTKMNVLPAPWRFITRGSVPPTGLAGKKQETGFEEVGWSNYPPAEPGALGCEPLEAAGRGR